jgi:hypothetical protein
MDGRERERTIVHTNITALARVYGFGVTFDPDVPAAGTVWITDRATTHRTGIEPFTGTWHEVLAYLQGWAACAKNEGR